MTPSMEPKKIHSAHPLEWTRRPGRNSNPVQIKICGLANPDAAAAVAEAGADAIGCVFFPKSPRNISEETALAICRALPRETVSVGVFVDEDPDEVIRRVRRCGLTMAQLHGAEDPAAVRRIADAGIRVIKGLYASRPPAFSDAAGYDGIAHAFLLECGMGALPGGNAAAWNWAAAAPFGERRPMILAGGLAPENVAEAIVNARPDAVDVSSGVESAPGVKDLDRVRSFIAAVKNAPTPNQPTRRIF